MSGEQLTAKESNIKSDVNSFNRSKSSKVDINDLLYRVREEKSKEKKENYVFLGLVIGVLVVTGVIVSL